MEYLMMLETRLTDLYGGIGTSTPTRTRTLALGSVALCRVMSCRVDVTCVCSRTCSYTNTSEGMDNRELGRRRSHARLILGSNSGKG